MGKTGFWLRGARGKLAGTTLYQSGGETIQREIVKPKNPRSDSQMRQRVVFAAASKFYSLAQQNRFTLAFMGKASNQSDFNMFMRENVKEGLEIYPTKQELDNPNFPLFNPWIVSKGNLPTVKAMPTDDYTDYVACNIVIADAEGALFTSWQQVIDANQGIGLQYGDIVTYTIVLSDAKFADGEIIPGENPMNWTTRQIIIGSDLGDTNLQNYLEANGFVGEGIEVDGIANRLGIDASLIKQAAFGTTADDFIWSIEACMIVATLSRKENGKLRVSNSQFLCSDTAQQIYTRLGYDSQLREAIASYKPSESSSVPTEVLEGSIAKNVVTKHSFAYSPDNSWDTNTVTVSRGATVTQEASGAFSVVMNDNNPSEEGNHKILLAGTGYENVRLQMLRYVVVGAGTDNTQVSIRFRVSDWGSATQVQVKYVGYAYALFTVKKPT